MSVKRHIQLESLAIILSAGILIGCGPSAEEQAATSVALTAAAATSTPRPTSTPTPIPGLLVPEDYLSIQDAIDAAEDGDSIVVSPGSYRENIDFSGKCNGIFILGDRSIAVWMNSQASSTPAVGQCEFDADLCFTLSSYRTHGRAAWNR